jgi:hypothetical protein
MVQILRTDFLRKFVLGWSGDSHEKFTATGNFFVLVAVREKEKKGRKRGGKEEEERKER